MYPIATVNFIKVFTSWIIVFSNAFNFGSFTHSDFVIWFPASKSFKEIDNAILRYTCLRGYFRDECWHNLIHHLIIEWSSCIGWVHWWGNYQKNSWVWFEIFDSLDHLNITIYEFLLDESTFYRIDIVCTHMNNDDIRSWF